jgi:hypothetical protein
VTRSRLTAAGALAAVALAAVPGVASAHGLVGKQDLPIPRWLFAWGAAVVLVISFVGLAALWPQPRLEGAAERRLLRVPLVLEVLCGAIGVAAFAISVYAGFAGIDSATANLMPTMFYVVFWVAVPFASLLFGDVFAAFSPWRAVARATAWAFGRLRGEAPAPLAYPAWLGQWPAALGILAFAWLELVYTNKDDPTLLAALALIYAAIQLVGMSLFGIRPWESNADAFGVYFGFFGRIGPLHWARRELWLRPPLVGVAKIVPVAGTVALLCVGIGTTSFDGMSQGAIWTGQEGIAPGLQQRFLNLGFSGETALEITFTIGLLAMVGLVTLVYRLGVLGMRSVDHSHSAARLARVFSTSLIPIAMAYVVAHYFSLLVYQGQALGFLISDPLGHGSNLFGTANTAIDYNVIGANGVWYVQVVALIIGHAAALALAHDRALVEYDDPRKAIRSQYWMLAVMVGFTSLGLFILSAAAQ